MEVGQIVRRPGSAIPERFTPCGVEVTVLHAQNVPQKPVLAIRAGDALRHVDLNLNAPFRVPVRDFKDGGSVNVSLYQQLGTQQILDVDEPESICSVPVRIEDGVFSQVKLRVRRGRPVPSSNILGSPADSDDYLSSHQLEAHIQRLFEIVLKTQPDDPYQCMLEELRKIKEKDVTEKGPRPPKAPLPPSSEPPSKSRPSAFKSRSKQRLSESSSQDSASLDPQIASSLALVNREVTNLEIAHEIMRVVLQRTCKHTSLQPTSPRWISGEKDEKRSFGVQACYYVKRLVFKACARTMIPDGQSRLSLGDAFDMMFEQSPDLHERRQEAKSLSRLIRLETFYKAALESEVVPDSHMEALKDKAWAALENALFPDSSCDEISRTI